MRHFICMSTAPIAPPSHALCVFVLAHTTALIASSGLTLEALTCAFRAATSAVALAPIAVAAHHDLSTTAGAQEHTGRRIVYSVRHGHSRQTGMCWTTTVPKCHNRIALVSNTVKGAAVGTNFHVRAAAAPAYFSVWALLERTGLWHINADITPNSNAAITQEALGPLA